MSKWFLLALAAPFVSSASGCARCSADGAVAELTAMQGAVDADDAAAPVAFAPTEVGRRFVVGEALRTAVDATAELSLRGGGTLHVEPESIVRFTRDASSANSRLRQGSSRASRAASDRLRDRKSVV